MHLPILNTLLPAAERWPELLRRNPDLEHDWRVVLAEFAEQADEIIGSTLSTCRGRIAQWLHGAWSPRSAELQQELAGIADYLGVDRHTLMAGQLVYDAATVGGIDARCGCTSMAVLHQDAPWHGRLLDWNWPTSIRGRIRPLFVRTRRGNFIAEHVPGATGFTGGYNAQWAANLNQAPVSGLRPLALPKLWWFRTHLENQALLRTTPPQGGMTDALIHVTARDGVTSRIHYVGGRPQVWRERLARTPVVMTNTHDIEGIEEDPDGYAWSKWREDAILSSRRRLPGRKLAEAECDETVHQWTAHLV